MISLTGDTSAEPWHGYTECPVCGGKDIREGVDFDNVDITIVFCATCGQTLHDSWHGQDDD